jgi:Domain of unknown function (DUF4960)
MKLKHFLFMVAFAIFSIGCGDDEPDVVTPPDVSITSFKLTAPVARTGVIDNTAKTISFQPLEPKSDLTKIVVEIALPAGATVNPASGSTVDFSKGPVNFTVTNVGKTSVYAVTVAAEFAPAIAFVGDPNAAGSITEPDTKAAYDYLAGFFKENMKYLAFSQVNADAIKYVDVIVFFTDSEAGKNPGILDAIPASAKNASVITALKAWHAAGGHFVLGGHATQYLNNLGRIPDYNGASYENNPYRAGIYGSGDGFWNWDQWGINPNMNVRKLATASTKDWNRTTHPIYKNCKLDSLSKVGVNTDNPNKGSYGHLVVPTDSYGFKEDHNSMWDINHLRGIPAYSNLDAFQLAEKFEQDMSCTILGTWGHVVDLCCGAALELNARPSNAKEGSIIAIGHASYDWDQKPHATAEAKPDWYLGNLTNTNVENTRNMTSNAVTYLLSK